MQKVIFLFSALTVQQVFFPPFSVVSGMICMPVSLCAVFEKVHAVKMCRGGEPQIVRIFLPEVLMIATFHELCYVIWKKYPEENSEGNSGQGEESLPTSSDEEEKAKV